MQNWRRILAVALALITPIQTCADIHFVSRSAISNNVITLEALSLMSMSGINGALSKVRSYLTLNRLRRPAQKINTLQIPAALLEQYPDYQDLLSIFRHSALDSAFQNLAQQDPSTAKQVLEIASQHQTFFAKGGSFLIPPSATPSGLSWAAGHIANTFELFPDLVVSALWTAGPQADVLQNDLKGGVEIDLRSFLARNAARLKFDVSDASKRKVAQNFIQFIGLSPDIHVAGVGPWALEAPEEPTGILRVNHEPTSIEIVVQFDGDVFHLSGDERLLTVPKILAIQDEVFTQRTVRHHRSLDMLQYFSAVVVAAAVLQQKATLLLLRPNSPPFMTHPSRSHSPKFQRMFNSQALAEQTFSTSGPARIHGSHLIRPVAVTSHPSTLYEEDLQALAELLRLKEIQNWGRRGHNQKYDFDKTQKNLKALASRNPLHEKAIHILLELLNDNSQVAAPALFWLRRYKHQENDADPIDVVKRLASVGWANRFSETFQDIETGPATKRPPDPVPRPKTGEAVVLEFINDLVKKKETLPDSVAELLPAERAHWINEHLNTWEIDSLKSIRQLEAIFGILATRGFLSAIHTYLGKNSKELSLKSEITTSHSTRSQPITLGHLRELAIFVNRIEISDLEDAVTNHVLDVEIADILERLCDRYYSNPWELELVAQQTWALSPEVTALRLQRLWKTLEITWPTLAKPERLKKSDPSFMSLDKRQIYWDTWIGEQAWIADSGAPCTIVGPGLSHGYALSPKLMRHHQEGLEGGQYIRLSILDRKGLIRATNILPGWKPKTRPGQLSEPKGVLARIPERPTGTSGQRLLQGVNYGEETEAKSDPIPQGANGHQPSTSHSIVPEYQLSLLEDRTLAWINFRRSHRNELAGPIQLNTQGDWRLSILVKDKPATSLTYRFDSSSRILFVKDPNQKNGGQRQLDILLIEALSYFPTCRILSITVPSAKVGWMSTWVKADSGLFSTISYQSIKGNLRTARGPLVDLAFDAAKILVEPLADPLLEPIVAQWQLPPIAEPNTQSTDFSPVKEVRREVSPALNGKKRTPLPLNTRPQLDILTLRPGQAIEEDGLGPVIFSGIVKRKGETDVPWIQFLLAETGVLVYRHINDFTAYPLKWSEIQEPIKSNLEILLRGELLPQKGQSLAKGDLDDEEELTVEEIPTLEFKAETTHKILMTSVAIEVLRATWLEFNIAKEIVEVLISLHLESPKSTIEGFVYDVFMESDHYSHKVASKVEMALHKLNIFETPDEHRQSIENSVSGAA